MIQKNFNDDGTAIMLIDDDTYVPTSKVLIKIINDNVCIYYGDDNIKPDDCDFIQFPLKYLVEFISEYRDKLPVIKLTNELVSIDAQRKLIIDKLKSICLHENIKNVDYYGDSGYDCDGWHKDSGGWSTCLDCGKHWNWLKDGKPR